MNVQGQEEREVLQKVAVHNRRFVEWLCRQYEAELHTLPQIPQEDSFRVVQGRCQVYKELMDILTKLQQT